MDPVYLDHNSTTPPTPEVIEAVTHAVRELWGNPSSVHRTGQNARGAVELARASLAKLIGAKPRQLVFTSSCTEAIDLGIRGVLEARRKNTVVTSDIEHAAVRELCEDLAKRGTEIRTIPTLPGGVYDLDQAAKLIDESVGVVAVQWANNETGTIQPIRQLGVLCAQAGVPLLVDAAQHVGKLPVDLSSDDFGIGLLAMSPHKFHGPKGVGALWVRRGVAVRPRVRGVQELARRGGTENVPGIIGAGVAAEQTIEWLSDPSKREAIGSLRDRLETLVLEQIPGAVLNTPSPPQARLWNTTNIGFPGRQAEAILIPMSERGVFASAGAACSSGSLDPSPVLLAMGIEPRVAHGSIRLTLGRETTEQEVARAVEVLVEIVLAGGARLE